MLATLLALVAVLLVVAWLAGGFLLRIAGIAVAVTGLLLALAGHPLGLLITAFGAVMWVAGHWHYALRHHTYKSPLARRLFLDVLREQLDPTRRWAIPTDNDHDR
ncbi:hypothetical protein [Conexibacter woesei]|uniref:hypothetical protein n=1 Tax=Conexibacter woesei TaxID=191495 RepID=UPI0012DBEEF1|nr:hypothetical protein [Conexibacter woesei]